MSIRFTFFTVLYFFCLNIFSQEGMHDKNIDWQYFDTPYIRMIFAKENQEQAFRIANIITYLHKVKKQKPFSGKTSIILQNQQSISNGFVTMFPFRSEFFLRSPQRFNLMGTGNWLDLLTLHEYQHVLQFQKSKVGITKFLYHLFGENGWAIGSGLSLPHWYFEGDATLAETLYSKNGRGRNPYFFAPQKALFLENILYDYNKARNGSFKDLVPSVYPLGYVIMQYLHQHFPDKKEAILNDTHRYQSIFYPFSNAIKKHTGYSTGDLYKKSYESLKSKWQKQLQNKILSQTKAVSTQKNKVITDYSFAHFLNDESIVAIKKSYTHTPQLVHIQKGKEKGLIHLDIAPQEFLSVNGKLVLWTALQRDVRYANKNYSVIMGYNLKNKTKKQLTFKTHFYAPFPSKDGKKIVCINAQNNGEYHLNILDTNSGALLKEIKNPHKDFISLPKWKDKHTVIYLVQRRQKIAFFKYNLKTDIATRISPWTRHSIGNYTIGKEHLYLSAGFDGTDDIYALHLKNKTFKRVSRVKVGAYTPCVNKDESICIFSEFTRYGQKLQSIKINLQKPSININSTTPFNIKKTKNHYPILDSIASRTYAFKPYKGVFKDWRVYNWGLQLNNTRPQLQDISLGLNAGNVLRNFTINGKIRYNTPEKTFTSLAEFRYSKYLLQLQGNIFKNNRRYTKLHRTLSSKELQNPILLTNNFSQTGISLGLTMPLQRIYGNYNQRFTIENNYTYRFISSQTLTDFISYGFKITAENTRRKARQNIASKFAQKIIFSLDNSFQANFAGRMTFYATFFLPALFVNDSFQVYYFWKNQSHQNTYLYSDGVFYARGYQPIINESLQTFSLNYKNPLWYPDFGFAGIFYIKRVHNNIFYDYTKIDADFYRKDFNNTFASIGVESFLDVIFLNMVPVTLGIRQSIKLKDIDNASRYTWKFLIHLNL